MNWTQFALLQLLIADMTRIYVESDGYGEDAIARLDGSIRVAHEDLKEMVERGFVKILHEDGLLTILTAGLEASHDGCNRFGKAMSLLERAVATEMSAPDETWFQEYFALTGEHMILTEEGWTVGSDKVVYPPEEILAEVNAPCSR